MTMHFARAKYRQANASSWDEHDDPHGIILVTLRELERVMKALAAAQQAATAYAPEHFSRAFTALYILQSSLDFEKGGEVATSLFTVYEYCRLQLVEAFSHSDKALLPAAADAISGIADAWSAITPGAQG